MPRAKKKKLVLFGDEDKDGSKEASLKVNEEFARDFEDRQARIDRQRKNTEIFRKKSQKNQEQNEFVYSSSGSSDSSSSSSSDLDDDDSDGEMDTKETHDQFLRILPLLGENAKKERVSALRQQVGIENPQRDFFAEENAGQKEQQKAAGKKPLRVADFLRKSLLKHGPEELDEDSLAREQSERKKKKKTSEDGTEGLSLVEEQALLKRQLLEAAEEDSDEDSDDGLLQVRKKSAADKEKEERDFLKFRSDNPEMFTTLADEMETLQSFWTETKNQPEDEKFLRDFFINKRWIERDDVPTHDQILGDQRLIDEEDDEAIDAQERFEHAYNFRFEEPGGAQIMTHPRPQMIEGSVRRDAKREKRAEARKARKARKEAEKREQREEMKRIKALKEREVAAKLKEIQEIAGAGVNFTVDDLEGDFDPEEFDRRMQEAFDDEWQAGEELERPDIGVALEYDVDAVDDDVDNFDNDEDDYIEGSEAGEESGSHDATNSEFKSRHKERKAFKRAHEAAKLKQASGELTDMISAYQDLEYEDIIDKTIKCRFKYTKVPADTFGLTLEQILEMDDKELNQRVSMKKLAPYRHMYPNARAYAADAARDYYENREKRKREGGNDRSSAGAGARSSIDDRDNEERPNKRSKGRSNSQRRAAKKAWSEQHGAGEQR